jgi:carbonic anhydrase/acetyltransferase-like protein (isoleucine patch superfamily)
MIRSFRGKRPSAGEGAYIEPSAQVIGDVSLGDHASVWMGAVLRGDINTIAIGARTNIQDQCVAEHYVDLKEGCRGESDTGEAR